VLDDIIFFRSLAEIPFAMNPYLLKCSESINVGVSNAAESILRGSADSIPLLSCSCIVVPASQKDLS
jgi:hypothetical protein